jgi:hypothetical protein
VGSSCFASPAPNPRPTRPPVTDPVARQSQTRSPGSRRLDRI